MKIQTPMSRSQLNPKILKAISHKLKAVPGFTLVEVLVSLFILGITLVGIITILTANSRSAVSIDNSYIAGGLVQEGVELVRNLRDGDWPAGRPFGAFGGPAAAADGSYRVQWNSSQLMSFADAVLRKDVGTGIYSYDAGADTIFKREVRLITVNPGVEKKIIVSVTWSERGTAKSVNAEEHLFNWR